ncbi:hypothetical protein SDC9_208841 [bioreactor metagenome]|uniref:Uncharacterized protein n=1 Tax=bioreactor metagenome TaxID=1076179 RepID=A0A645JCQ4_9ZZZZ
MVYILHNHIGIFQALFIAVCFVVYPHLALKFPVKPAQAACKGSFTGSVFADNRYDFPFRHGQ